MNQINCNNKLPPVIIPKNPKDYQSADILERRWKLSYGKNDIFYLTDLERQYFLSAISNGVINIQIGDLTLSNHFLYMTPIKRGKRLENATEVITMTENDKKMAKIKLDEIKKKLNDKLFIK
jgi:hypothetical protein